MSVHCSWADALREAAARLREAGVEQPMRDASLLLADALKLERAELIAREQDAPDWDGLAAFEARLVRRLAGEPVSRIRGWREFYGRRFHVTPDVLDPRPETELLVEQGLERLSRNGVVVDLGVGSGCILLSVLAERLDATGWGVDVSAAALDVARGNGEALGVADRAQFVEASWDWRPDERADLVLSNPPYIEHAAIADLSRDVREYDPVLALDGGEDGLAPYGAIARAMQETLRPGGWLGVEFGLGQEELVGGLLAAAGLQDVDIYLDLSGLKRAAFGRRPAKL